MRDTQSETIDGLAITATQLPTTRAVKLLTRIARVVGPALGEGGMKLMESDDKLGAALATFFDRATPDEVDAILKELMESVTIDGHALGANYETLFRGKLATLFKVAAFSFRVNFGNFFDALPGLAPLRSLTEPSKSAA